MQHTTETDDHFAGARAGMLKEIAQEAAEAAGWTGRSKLRAEVLEAVGRVPRERFIAAGEAAEAYRNRPLPIGCAQTISQPFIVALMSDLCGAGPGKRILEIGTGCGYQAAVLAELGAEVWSIESLPELYEGARTRLRNLKYRQIHLRLGDGTRGWPEAAPFHGIIVTAAAARRVPPALIDQLAAGGALVCPVAEGGSLGSLLGTPTQRLYLIQKDVHGVVSSRDVLPVAFVPLVEGS
ncbi:protein-L-isoaspartate(D-aspartate) O-methyltransferase [Algihabitans albus]|uniref:protein-L-isoaspartate(D-aspartate) O-methyltransferase n=1 Tax=Algihabitans albus TaxID=2164067 RepID=UPI0013C327D4|nr:protein-L-isoaspartate(D-aspartate) O-methyltransferase [Algihabitans albus]